MENSLTNTWTLLFLLVSAAGFFLSFLLFTDKKGRRHNWSIAVLILGFSLVLIYYVAIWTGYTKKYPYALLIDNAWYLAFGPLIYSYILRFYNEEIRTKYTHFIPSILLLALSIYYLITIQGISSYGSSNEDIIIKIYWSLRQPWVGIASLFIYLWITTDAIKTYSKIIKQNQASYTRNRWSSLVMNFYKLFCFAYLSYYILVLFPFFNPLWDYTISFTMAIGIYGIGYMVYTESRIFNGELLAQLFIPKYNTNEPQLTEETKDEFYNQLITHVEQHKSYLNFNLRLVHLADELGFSTHLLSQIINEKASKNFNQFINDYRLKEAEHLLTISNTNVKAICYDVGFNSKTTFYNAFKKKHNCTPLTYKHRLSEG